MPLGGADPALLGADDGHGLALDEILDGMCDLGRRVAEFGATAAELGLAAELAFRLLHLGRDRLPLQILVLQQRLQVLALGGELLVLAPDLELLEAAQGAQAHVQDRFGLRIRESESLDHLGLGLVLLADDLDQLVEVQIGDQIAFEDFQPPLDRLQPEGRTPHQHLAAMVEKRLKGLAQVHHPRGVVLVEDVEVEREPDLEVGELEQLLHQQFGGNGARARLEHDPNVVGGLVPHVVEDGQLLGVDDLGDALDQPALLDLVGNLRDDDAILAARKLFDRPAGAQTEGTASRAVGLDDRVARLDQHAPGREIRPLDEVDEGFDAGVGRLDEMQQGVAELARIVRRDRTGHAHGDAGRPVRQQVGKPAGQHHGFLGGTVVVRAEVDGVLVDAGQQGLGHLGQAGLGVTHGGSVIAVDVAEVSLALDQRIAGGEFLRQPHQGVIDRLVAVRMILADHVADDAGALLEGAVGIEPQLPHGVHQAAMDRLQPVADVRQRARHDGRQRIGQVALLERLSELHRLDRSERNDVVAFCHRQD